MRILRILVVVMKMRRVSLRSLIWKGREKLRVQLVNRMLVLALMRRMRSIVYSR